MTRSAFAQREQAFGDQTDSQLDDFITQAQTLLENLADQHGVLKVSVETVERESGGLTFSLIESTT
jgi:hypothetical protein